MCQNVHSRRRMFYIPRTTWEQSSRWSWACQPTTTNLPSTMLSAPSSVASGLCGVISSPGDASPLTAISSQISPSVILEAGVVGG